ncbi:hypothetical protein GGF41_007679, partial [Coemansia sp. RSA 2531]
LTPADVIADIQELALWRNLAHLSSVAGSLPYGSLLRGRVLSDLRAAVAAASVGEQSPWALTFTRLAWLVNDRSSESAAFLSLCSDISYRWYVRLADCSPLVSLLDSPALRLAQSVATELAWRMAPRLDCALGDRDQAERQSRDLLKSLALYQPPVPSAADELATVLGSVLQAVSAVGDVSEALAFTQCSELVLEALVSLPVDADLAADWHRLLMLVAAPVADIVEPAANAVRHALTAQGDGLESAYVAMVEVAVCLLHISVPRRPVDPAAKARTQWMWLGEDVDISRADLAAYRVIQRSMTGDEDTSATVPFARRVADLERQHSAIELVYRPEEVGRGEPSFTELWQEAHNLVSSVLGRVHDLNIQLSGMETVSSDAFAKTQGAVMALLGTLEQFENRVVRRYFESYRDVAQI